MLQKEIMYTDTTTGETFYGKKSNFYGDRTYRYIYLNKAIGAVISGLGHLKTLLDWRQMGIFHDIVDMYLSKDGILRYKKESGRTAIVTKKMLGEIYLPDASPMTRYRVFITMFKERVLVEFKDTYDNTCIQVNPIYATWKNKISFDTFYRYRDDLKLHMSEEGYDRVCKYAENRTGDEDLKEVTGDLTLVDHVITAHVANLDKEAREKIGEETLTIPTFDVIPPYEPTVQPLPQHDSLDGGSNE